MRLNQLFLYDLPLPNVPDRFFKGYNHIFYDFFSLEVEYSVISTDMKRKTFFGCLHALSEIIILTGKCYCKKSIVRTNRLSWRHSMKVKIKEELYDKKLNLTRSMLGKKVTSSTFKKLYKLLFPRHEFSC